MEDDYDSFGPTYFPHKFPDLWEKTKELFSKKVETISDINKIFFKNKSDFLKELEKTYPEEGIEFVNVFKYISSLVLDIEKLFPDKEFETLKKKTTDKVILNRKQIALIFILGFFDIFNLDYKRTKVYHRFYFGSITDAKGGPDLSKGRSFINYMTIIGKWIKDNNKLLEENVTYIREYKNFKDEYIIGPDKLCEIDFIQQGSLFDSKASFFVDFANKYIGGGALSGGCVQEEILFAVEPEAIVSMFFMEVMDDNDAIRIDNLIQYSDYSGYGMSFKFEGNAIKNENIKKYNIIAIDAVCTFSSGGVESESVERDLIKAYVGFNLINFEDEKVEKLEKTIATGNWGCGVFGGDFELKFIQQWLAATYAGVKKLYYYTFGKKEMNFAYENLEKIKSINPNVLYSKLMKLELVKGEVLKILLNEGIEDKKEVKQEKKTKIKNKTKKCYII